MSDDLKNLSISPTSAEMDELNRLRQTLGDAAFNEIQRTTWNEYIATHKPPYAPGIWAAFLEALRNAVQH
jgi:hypothetical protein